MKRPVLFNIALLVTVFFCGCSKNEGNFPETSNTIEVQGTVYPLAGLNLVRLKGINPQGGPPRTPIRFMAYTEGLGVSDPIDRSFTGTGYVVELNLFSPSGNLPDYGSYYFAQGSPTAYHAFTTARMYAVNNGVRGANRSLSEKGSLFVYNNDLGEFIYTLNFKQATQTVGEGSYKGPAIFSVE